MRKSLRVLMDGLIDYAGLFPPASLDMAAAVRNFAAYRAGVGPEARWLGRFVLPASRLDEFAAAAGAGDAAAGTRPAGTRTGEAPWRLSVLIGADFEAGLRRVEAFNREAASHGPRAARIDALELKAARPEEIAAAMAAIPTGLAAYFEFSPRAEAAPFLAALAPAGARAKLRTGGVTPDLIPGPEEVARFLMACARAKVPFKATAGLHHPVRSRRRLTYAPDGPEAVMHGFLNVFLAAALAYEGAGTGELAEALREEDPGAFRFGEDGVAWRDRSLPLARLEAVRGEFALGFGSCSFEEPRQDLMEAKLL